MLCQIEKCWSYAEKHNRILVIDSLRSGILDDFSKYFKLKHKTNVFFALDSRLALSFETMTTFPASLSGRIATYETEWKPESISYYDKHSGEQISLDFGKEYPETLIVHENEGGGLKSLECIKKLKLTDSASAFIRQKLSSLPKGYVAVHVRNTGE